MRPVQESTDRGSADQDAHLVAVAKHHRAEFVALYDKYFVRVYHYIVQRVGTQQDAEDITSLVFMEAMRSLDNYREQGSFASWLFSIARHKVADHYRQSNNEISLTIVEGELVSEIGIPENRAVIEERLQRLGQALRSLTPEKQEILVLRFFGELKYREIASILNKRESAVKMMVYRALDELRETVLTMEGERDVQR